MTLADGSVWLAAGSLVNPTQYPVAAKLPQLQVFGGQGVSLPATIIMTGYATNGSGTIVVAYGNTTNLLVSTNYGQTWALVSHGLSYAVNTVAYGAGYFVAVGGNGGANMSFSYSATGTSAFTSIGIVAGTYGNTNPYITFQNGTFVCASATASGASIWSSTTGTSFNNNANVAVANTGGGGTAQVAYGSTPNTWIVMFGGTTGGAFLYTTTPTGSWTGATTGPWLNAIYSNGSYFQCASGTYPIFSFYANTTSYFQFTGGAGYTNPSWPFTIPYTVSGVGITANGGEYVFPMGNNNLFQQVAITTDLVNFKFKSYYPTSGSQMPIRVGNAQLIMPVGIGGSISYFSPKYPSPDYVGITNYAQIGTIANGNVGYVPYTRIK